MKSDAEIRNDVIDELRWDPQIPEPDAIGVAVTDGAVTLTGHVATYAQKLAAALKTCKKKYKSKKAKRQACEKQARKKYGAKKSTKSKSSGAKSSTKAKR